MKILKKVRATITVVLFCMVFLTSVVTGVKGNVLMQENEDGSTTFVPDRIISMVDRPTSVELKRLCFDGTTPAEGCKMKLIRKSDGEEVQRWVSSSTGNLLEGVLETGETYVFTEVAPSEEHQSSEIKEFTVKDSYETQVVEIKDDTVLSVNFKASNGEDLSGLSCEYTIFNSAGQEAATGNKLEQSFLRLNADEQYYINVTHIPKGFELSDNNNLFFTFDKLTGRATVTILLNQTMDLPSTGGGFVIYPVISLILLISVFIIILFQILRKRKNKLKKQEEF